MSKARSTGNLNNSILISDTGAITFVSGSTTLLSVNTTGQLSGSTAVKAAATASYADSFTVAGTLTAQTLVVQTITSSVSMITGSTKFGIIDSNTHQFTGSLLITGSIGIGTTPSTNATPLIHLYNPTATRLRLESTTSTANAIDFYSGSTAQWSIVVDNNQAYGKIENRFLGSDAIRFYSSSNNVALVPTSGNVGIGTTSPNGNLEVSASTPVIISGASSAGSFHGIEFRQNNTVDAFIKQLPSTGEFKLSVGRNSSWGGNMTFFTDTIERMRIASYGTVGIGTTSPNSSAKLHIQSSTGNANDNVGMLQVESTYSSGTGQSNNASLVVKSYYGYSQFMQWDSNGLRMGVRGVTNGGGGSVYITYSTDGVGIRIDNGGSVYNAANTTTWQQTSDIRIKQNIRPVSDALTKLCALKPSHFEYKNNLGVTKTGFIAQEFEQVLPGHVYERKVEPEYQQYFEEGEMIKVLDPDLLPYLVKAIQELKAENDTLKEILQRNNIQ